MPGTASPSVWLDSGWSQEHREKPKGAQGPTAEGPECLQRTLEARWEHGDGFIQVFLLLLKTYRATRMKDLRCLQTASPVKQGSERVHSFHIVCSIIPSQQVHQREYWEWHGNPGGGRPQHPKGERTRPGWKLIAVTRSKKKSDTGKRSKQSGECLEDAQGS